MTTITTIGRITKDVELKTGKSGCVYANFGLAVNQGFGDNQKTVFYDCSAFNEITKRLESAKVKKGSLLQVVGDFSIEEFTRKNGDPGYSLKLTVLAWSYIPGTSGKKDANNENVADSNNAQAPEYTEEMPPHPADDFDGITNFDEEAF